MVNQFSDGRLADNLTSFAQSQIEELDTYNDSYIWSHAAEVNAEKTARLALPTFRGMGLITGDIGVEIAYDIAQDSDPLSDEDRFAINLLTEQARGMVIATGEHSTGWVNSRASRAVAARTGELAVRVAKELSGAEYIKPRAFVHSFSGILMDADIAIQPGVMDRIETQWNSDDLRQEAVT